ncbi:hypothetical protein [Rhodoferax ferrireducens]|uniref:hypothetical protein n=1 Tax=Rhodoferax ferrireducens TaxID=192843 RepID=UPI0013006D65|nr:hypothetical protein [Rhodoferax ferrireducens]
MKNKIFAASVLGLTLMGCGGGGGGSADDAPDNTDLVPVPVARPAVSFAKVILPWYVGSYTGTKCVNDMSSLENELPPQTLNITADGLISMSGVSANLLDRTGIEITRKLDASGPLSVSVRNLATATDSYLPHFFLTGDHLKNGVQVWHFKPGNEVRNRCEESSDVSALVAKPIYPLVHTYIETPPVALTCAASGSFVDATYQVLDGVATFNGESYAFESGLKEEFFFVDPSGQAIYSTKALDGAAFQLALDTYGQTINVLFTSKTGVTSSCVPKK